MPINIISVPEDRVTPENLLAWNRGHWSVENRNYRVRGVNFGKNTCLSRMMHAPFNGAICNCIALAIILKRHPNIAETRRHFALHRHEAIEAVLPGRERLQGLPEISATRCIEQARTRTSNPCISVSIYVKIRFKIAFRDEIGKSKSCNCLFESFGRV